LVGFDESQVAADGKGGDVVTVDIVQVGLRGLIDGLVLGDEPLFVGRDVQVVVKEGFFGEAGLIGAVEADFV